MNQITTDVQIDPQYYEDGTVVISIDRKKGNPNRIAEVSYKGYETSGEVSVSSNNAISVNKIATTVAMKIKQIYTLNEQVEIRYTSNISGTVQVNIFDITGRNISKEEYRVKSGVNNIKLNKGLKTGVYFAIVSNGKERQTRKFAVVK